MSVEYAVNWLVQCLFFLKFLASICVSPVFYDILECCSDNDNTFFLSSCVTRINVIMIECYLEINYITVIERFVCMDQCMYQCKLLLGIYATLMLGSCRSGNPISHISFHWIFPLNSNSRRQENR